MFRNIFCCILFLTATPSAFFIPIKSSDRKNTSTIQLTEIGQFGLVRKARKTVASHLHTGIDIKRPGKNYSNEPIFPITDGKIISKRTDGPFAQLIIEHKVGNNTFWTLYEHIAGITVNIADHVSGDTPIARFMNKKELDKYGWQFDHVHLEILKKMPIRLQPSKTHPERLYNAYTLNCHTHQDLDKYYYSPLSFLKENIH